MMVWRHGLEALTAAVWGRSPKAFIPQPLGDRPETLDAQTTGGAAKA